MVKIIKTSEQAQKEKMQRTTGSKCPECNFPAVLHIREVYEGLFVFKERKKYTCFECGCQWVTDWKR